MVFYPLVLQFYDKKWEKEKKKMILTKEKKTVQKQNSATMIWYQQMEKGHFLQWSWNYKGHRFIWLNILKMKFLKNN